MSERERLVELVNAAKDQHPAVPLMNGCKPDFGNFLADYLLANGIICPPCKVGDTVYKISRNIVRKCEVVYLGISADEKCSRLNFVENHADGTFYKSYSMVFDVIGKTVFLTREEAEKALAERMATDERN